MNHKKHTIEPINLLTIVVSIVTLVFTGIAAWGAFQQWRVSQRSFNAERLAVLIVDCTNPLNIISIPTSEEIKIQELRVLLPFKLLPESAEFHADRFYEVENPNIWNFNGQLFDVINNFEIASIKSSEIGRTIKTGSFPIIVETQHLAKGMRYRCVSKYRVKYNIEFETENPVIIKNFKITFLKILFENHYDSNALVYEIDHSSVNKPFVIMNN